MDNSSTIWTVFTIFLLLTLSPPAGADTSLIKKTCKSTKYYHLCLSSVNSNSTSSTADVRGLALIMIRIGMANATASSTYLSSQLAASGNNDTVAKKAVLKECADLYMYVANNLEMTVEDFDMGNESYAPIHVTGASYYPDQCRDTFRRNKPRLVYPTELASRADGLKRICHVILQIIDLLIVKY
ncbi:Cell wall / vacuolar inhibitor of fructosidase 2 [Linum grandiflorum]